MSVKSGDAFARTPGPNDSQMKDNLASNKFIQSVQAYFGLINISIR